VVLFPNCKINIGLHVLRKREDGFRDIETLFYPLPFQDGLEIISLPGDQSTIFTTSGFEIPGDSNENSCLKAYQILKKDYPSLPPVRIHLHKVIPIGAGLGGGSADASFTLIALNKKFQLGLNDEKLIEYAAQIGSDCSFFILNKPCIVSGRGENLEPYPIDLVRYKIVLVWPRIHINTGTAYGYVRSFEDRPGIKELLEMPITKWKDHLKNDFEPPLFERIPDLKKIKNKLYEKGALYASLSGSGSTLYGLFTYSPDLTLDFPEEYLVKIV
jgi:4-diphosphocytidyl-2-C-methyl-D-erythritol kinase